MVNMAEWLRETKMLNLKTKNKISNLKSSEILVVVLTFTLLVLSLGKVSVLARSTLPLTVAPARQKAFVDPGKTTAVNIKFFNRGDTPVSGLLKVADFIVSDKEGTPEFLEGPTKISSRFAAASWVKLPYSRITIAPKDKVLIQVKINAPKNARPGGKYLAIYFEPGGKPGQPKGRLREATTPVAERIAGLVYLRVSGPIAESASVTQFSAPNFSEYGPTAITTEILNQGDYHIRPRGTITLTNLLGRQIDKVKIKEENIFPDASRNYKNKLGQKWMFGKYKAHLSASYGETGKLLEATIFFWVFPWKVAAAAVLAIVITILLITNVYKKIKKHQQEMEARIKELEKKLEEK
jgi:hypothetical protein